jgi:hypothetical protein
MGSGRVIKRSNESIEREKMKKWMAISDERLQHERYILSQFCFYFDEHDHAATA